MEKIVHRDISARNVLLTSTYEAKISDFGLSRRSVQESGNKTVTAVGPLRWMVNRARSHRVSVSPGFRHQNAYEIKSIPSRAMHGPSVCRSSDSLAFLLLRFCSCNLGRDLHESFTLPYARPCNCGNKSASQTIIP